MNIVYLEPSFSMRTDGQTDIYNEANGHFRKFANARTTKSLARYTAFPPITSSKEPYMPNGQPSQSSCRAHETVYHFTRPVRQFSGLRKIFRCTEFSCTLEIRRAIDIQWASEVARSGSYRELRRGST